MRMMIVAALGLLVSACASVAAVNDKGGIVQRVGSAGRALKLADAYCAKSGQTAKAGEFSIWSSTLTFECVAK